MRSLPDEAMMTKINKTIGERLRVRRLLLNKSQVELAQDCDISPQQIHKYERGQSGMSTARLVHFANIMDVPVSYFYEGLEERPVTIYPHRIVALLAERNVVELLNLFLKLDKSTRFGLLGFLRVLARDNKNGSPEEFDVQDTDLSLGQNDHSRLNNLSG